MRRKFSKDVATKFKWMIFCFTVLTAGTLLTSAIDVSRWAGYDDSVASEYDRGQIVEYADKNDFCHSYVLLPGVPLIHKSILIIAYFLCL